MSSLRFFSVWSEGGLHFDSGSLVLSDNGSWGSRLVNDTGWMSLLFDSGGRGILLFNDWGRRNLFDNRSGLRFFNDRSLASSSLYARRIKTLDDLATHLSRRLRCLLLSSCRHLFCLRRARLA
jgi:hypothetical protein